MGWSMIMWGDVGWRDFRCDDVAYGGVGWGEIWLVRAGWGGVRWCAVGWDDVVSGVVGWDILLNKQEWVAGSIEQAWTPTLLRNLGRLYAVLFVCIVYVQHVFARPILINVPHYIRGCSFRQLFLHFLMYNNFSKIHKNNNFSNTYENKNFETCAAAAGTLDSCCGESCYAEP